VVTISCSTGQPQTHKRPDHLVIQLKDKGQIPPGDKYWCPTPDRLLPRLATRGMDQVTW